MSTGRCHLVRPLVRLNLVSLSFPISDLPPSVGRILSSSFSSALVSRNTVVSLVPAWVQFELGQLGIFANSFVDSLGWLLQGEFVVFPWSFHWIPMSFSLLNFQMSLTKSASSGFATVRTLLLIALRFALYFCSFLLFSDLSKILISADQHSAQTTHFLEKKCFAYHCQQFTFRRQKNTAVYIQTDERKCL